MIGVGNVQYDEEEPRHYRGGELNMNPAVVVSGIWNGEDIEEKRKYIQKFFPYDIFFTSWTNEKLDNTEVVQFEEPEDNFCKLALCPDKKRFVESLPLKGSVWTSVALVPYTWGNKQIYGHALALEKLDPKYDMVIKLRWDIFLFKNINWIEYVEKSYEFNSALGFNAVKNNVVGRPVRKIYASDENPKKRRPWGYGLNDQLIIYPRKLFNPKRTIELFNNTQLRGAESGWWQMLIEENYGFVDYTIDPCVNYYGGVLLQNHLKYVSRELRKINRSIHEFIEIPNKKIDTAR